MFPVGRLLRISSLASCLWPLSAGDSVTLAGILYSRQGGPSGTSVGIVRVAVGAKIYHLRYQQPYPQALATPACRDIGARWKVSAKMLSATDGLLQTVTCDGKFENDIHEAWLVVRTFMDHVVESRWQSSLALLSPEFAKSPEFKSFRDAAESVDLSGYRAFGGQGRCLEVGEAPPSHRVRIETGPGCLLMRAGRPTGMTFWVAHGASSWRRQIQAIEIRPID